MIAQLAIDHLNGIVIIFAIIGAAEIDIPVRAALPGQIGQEPVFHFGVEGSSLDGIGDGDREQIRVG